MNKIKVIIVDDSAVIRSLFSEMLSKNEDIEVVAVAEDPYDAREKIKRYNPDVITLDVEMPKMDGISFLEKIMTLRPMPVIMISSLTTRGADITLQAMEMGAVDYIAKPQMLDEHGYKKLQEELTTKIRHAAGVNPRVRTAAPQAIPLHRYEGDNSKYLIAIGASTGGVEALREIIPHLPASTPPIVITQHMPEIFTNTFALRLDSLSAMTVTEAKDGEKILPGHVYIAPGNWHMEIQERGNDLYCHLHSGPAVSGHRPSVDVLFNSVAQIKKRSLLGIILTGMGRDGADGLLKLYQAGARTLGQSEASSVVYGMPKAAKLLGGVETEVPLGDMAKHIIKLCTIKDMPYASTRN